MLDEIADLLELFFSAGISSPETLEKQRRLRLVAGSGALVVNAAILLMFSRPTEVVGWSVLAIATLAGGWVLAFSAVDTARELPSVPWLSVVAFVTALKAIALAGLIVF